MDLIARLLAAPQRFEFVQAMRLLLLALARRGIPPRQALRRHLRFANSLSLAFPASEIAAITHDPRAPVFALTPTFMGLLGVHGALPLHVSERLQACLADGDDDGARAFLDLLSTRMPALWYEAWRKHRVEELVGGERDAFLPLLLALAGLAPGAGGVAVPDRALAAHAGLLRRRPLSAAVLGRLLSDHFGVPVCVQEGIGHWSPLTSAEQTALGGARALLGRAALVGARSWRPDLRVRIRIGPLDPAGFEHFMPRAAGAQALATLLGLCAPPTLAYEIVPVLRRADVAPAALTGAPAGTSSGVNRRLGLDSFLLSGPASADRADLHYTLHPLPPLPDLKA